MAVRPSFVEGPGRSDDPAPAADPPPPLEPIMSYSTNRSSHHGSHPGSHHGSLASPRSHRSSSLFSPWAAKQRERRGTGPTGPTGPPLHSPDSFSVSATPLVAHGSTNHLAVSTVSATLGPRRSRNYSLSSTTRRRKSFTDGSRSLSQRPASPAEDRAEKGTRKLDVLSVQEEDNIRALFHKYDSGGKGSLGIQDLLPLLQELGHPMPEAQALDLLHQVDANGNDFLEFPELIQMVLIFKNVAQFRLYEQRRRSSVLHEQLMERAAATGQSSRAFVLHPGGRWRWFWDTFILVVCGYLWFSGLWMHSVPGSDSMSHAEGLRIPDGIMTAAIFMQMVVSMSTALESDRGLILERWPIAKAYLTSFFATDLMALLPLRLFVTNSTAGLVLSQFRLLFVLRVPFLLQAPHSTHINRDFIHFYFMVAPLLRNGLYFAMAVHCFACISWQHIESVTTYAAAVYQVMYVIAGAGYGDLNPSSTVMRWYLSGLFVLSMLINGMVIGGIVSFLATSDLEAMRRSRLVETLAVLNFFEVPQSLQEEILQFQDHVLKRDIQVAFGYLTDHLPNEMKVGLTLQLRIQLIRSVDAFAVAHESTQIALSQLFKPQVLCPEDYVVLAGEEGDVAYFVNYGFVDLFTAGNIYKETLSIKEHFGIEVLFASVADLVGSPGPAKPHARAKAVASPSDCAKGTGGAAKAKDKEGSDSKAGSKEDTPPPEGGRSDAPGYAALAPFTLSKKGPVFGAAQIGDDDSQHAADPKGDEDDRSVDSHTPRTCNPLGRHGSMAALAAEGEKPFADSTGSSPPNARRLSSVLSPEARGRYYYSAKTLTYVEMLVLEGQSFRTVLQEYPRFRNQMADIAASMDAPPDWFGASFSPADTEEPLGPSRHSSMRSAADHSAGALMRSHTSIRMRQRQSSVRSQQVEDALPELQVAAASGDYGGLRSPPESHGNLLLSLSAGTPGNKGSGGHLPVASPVGLGLSPSLVRNHQADTFSTFRLAHGGGSERNTSGPGARFVPTFASPSGPSGGSGTDENPSSGQSMVLPPSAHHHDGRQVSPTRIRSQVAELEARLATELQEFQALLTRFGELTAPLQGQDSLQLLESAVSAPSLSVDHLKAPGPPALGSLADPPRAPSAMTQQPPSQRDSVVHDVNAESCSCSVRSSRSASADRGGRLSDLSPQHSPSRSAPRSPVRPNFGGPIATGGSLAPQLESPYDDDDDNFHSAAGLSSPSSKGLTVSASTVVHGLDLKK